MTKPVELAFELHRESFSLQIDTHLPGDGVTAVFGPSGSGKTTLIRCMAGLERVPGARMTVDGDVWQDSSRFLPAHKRPVGVVFQESSLFPHLSARQNLEFAVKRAQPGAASLEETADLLGIADRLDSYPVQLSGGERQRVAIARALLINPRLLLMDEPLASLDASRKQEILPYVERLRSQLSIPLIYISHSPEEVARLADHIVVLEKGRVRASGPLTEVYGRLDLPLGLGPDTGVVLEATVEERDETWGLVRATFDGGELWVHESGDLLEQVIRVRVLARDVSLALAPHRDTSILNLFEGRVDAVDDDDAVMVLVTVKVGRTSVIARVTRRSMAKLGLRVGDRVWAQVKSVAIVR